MKHLLLTTIAAVLLVGCGGGQQLTPAPETQTEKPVDKAQAPPKPEIETVTKSPKQVPPIVKAPEISIHTAALKGDMKAVKQHLVAGTDVNQKGSGIIFSYQGTPLHQAAGNGHVEIAEILIANGANVNAKDRLEQTPLDRAYLKSDKAFVELLRKHNGKSGAEDSINVAVMVMNMEAIKQHLAVGAELNDSDASHKTPLHWAATRGGKSGRHIAELLLANGADVNARDDNMDVHVHKYGWTALSIAAFYGRKEIVELLIDKGADVNARDINGVTPLHSIFTEKLKQREPGTRTGHIVSIAKLLINAGANVNAVANNGATPLDEALESRHIDLKDLLCKHGGKTGAELKAEGK